MKYFWATIRHKWFVLLAARKIGLPLWRALIHDLSKFTRAELPHYQRQFYGARDDLKGFAIAWLHHQHYNDHHWEHWITCSLHSHSSQTRDGGVIENDCLPMPRVCVKEMVADWLGASKAYTGAWDMDDWLRENLYKMRLHSATKEAITEVLVAITGKVYYLCFREDSDGQDET